LALLTRECQFYYNKYRKGKPFRNIIKKEVIMSNIVKFDPFAEIQFLQKQLLSDDWFSPIKTMQMPTTDVYTKDDNELHVESHLPNFDQKDVDVHVDKGMLVIRAERHEQEKDKEKKYIVRESSSSFYRSIRLPEIADENNIQAKMKNGVLKVTVKLKELPKPKQITIEA